MKKKKIWAAGLFLCMSAQFLCACQEQQANTTEELHVGVTCYNESDTFISELMTSFREQIRKFESDELKVTVTVRDAAGSQRTQD